MEFVVENILFVISFTLISFGALYGLRLFIKEILCDIIKSSEKKKFKKPKNRNKVAYFIYDQLINEYGEENIYGSPFQSHIFVKTKSDTTIKITII